MEPSYQYRHSHYKDKTVSRPSYPSYLYDGNPIPGNTVVIMRWPPCVFVTLWAPVSLHTNTEPPDSKVHGTNMGPTWVLSAPDGPHVGPMNLAIRGPCQRCPGTVIPLLDPSHKSHSTSDISVKAPYCNINVHISVTKWSVVGYGTSALRDLRNRGFLRGVPVRHHSAWKPSPQPMLTYCQSDD